MSEAASLPDLPLLNETEHACLARYRDLLLDTLGNEVVEIVVFGSVARGESWPPGMPIRSDLDLLVVTETALPRDAVERKAREFPYAPLTPRDEEVHRERR